jgi:hypothetical protein
MATKFITVFSLGLYRRGAKEEERSLPRVVRNGQITATTDCQGTEFSPASRVRVYYRPAEVLQM